MISVLSSKVRLQPYPLGEAYFRHEMKGPYVRYSTTQEGHLEDGLQFWLRNTDPDKIKEVSRETSDKGTILHIYFSHIVKGEKYKVEEKHEWAKPAIERFEKFFKEGF